MKYGMNMLLWSSSFGVDDTELFQSIKNMGYDGVEIPMFELDVKACQDLGNLLDGIGLERTAVTVCSPEANPISESAEVRQEAVDHLKKVVDCCEALGVQTLAGPLHSALGEFSGQGATDAEWKRGQEVLLQVADHAEQAKVMLAIEYLNRFECYFLNSAEDCSRFTREANHPYLKMMYDSFHAHIEEKDPTAAIKTCIDQTVHVHISENDRSTPGEGQINWDATFSALKEVGYDGWMVVEAFGLALPELAAATRIWRKMFPDEEYLASHALKFMKSRVEG